jgi:hypothetical protein
MYSVFTVYPTTAYWDTGPSLIVYKTLKVTVGAVNKSAGKKNYKHRN